MAVNTPLVTNQREAAKKRIGICAATGNRVHQLAIRQLPAGRQQQYASWFWKGVGMFVFLLWLFSVVIGGLLVLSFAYAKFAPAYFMLEPRKVNPAPRVKGIRKD